MHLRKKGLDTNPSCEVYEQRDVDAAQALVKMANSVDLLPKNVSRENAAVQISDHESNEDSRNHDCQFSFFTKMQKATTRKLRFQFASVNAVRRSRELKSDGGDLSLISDKTDENTKSTKMHELSKGLDLTKRSRRMLQHESLQNLGDNTVKKDWSVGAGMCDVKLSRNSMDSFFEGELSRYEKDPDAKSAKKHKSILNLPAICDAFSFSVVHLISAVRIALITPFSEDYVPLHGKNLEGQPGNHKQESSISGMEEFVRGNLPSLTTHEIVQRVRLNPRDYRILEAKEPLQDLVRGVLNILASRTAPSGAIYWKALVMYEGNSKRWSWIGPLPSHYLPVGHVQEEMSPASWGLSRRTLEKLISSFAEWLKTGQETCQKIGSLPKPPQGLVQCFNTSERLIESRGVKSLKTINPITEDIRAYFRQEEALRYMIPQRVFSYTALDGRKSAVAPIVRISGKPSTKIRQHHILKENRPPYFTVVCLVRDAAARLPGRMGTRADICALVRDSQFIIEDVSEMQINQVISGALDRLHYEVDPCVRFDKEARVWVYLHGDREEEDFENVYTGTQTMKKAKTENNIENSGTEQGSFKSNT